MRRLAGRRTTADPRAPRRGQSLVEFAMIVPVVLLLLVGMLEFGFIFDQAMTLNYATREGARSGAAFASGNDTTMVCTTSTDIDKHIIAAVQRVLEAPGSRVDVTQINEIRIYKATSTGDQAGGAANVWTYQADGGPAVDLQNLDFAVASTNWNACTRDNTWTAGNSPDLIGISISYTYRMVTPIGSLLGFFGSPGGGTLPISDRSIMALNPTN